MFTRGAGRGGDGEDLEGGERWNMLSLGWFVVA